MAKGLREVFIQSLRDAGFTEQEAEALASAWNRSIRPVIQGLLDDIATAVREEYIERGAPLTNQVTINQMRTARELYVTDRLVLCSNFTTVLM